MFKIYEGSWFKTIPNTKNKHGDIYTHSVIMCELKLENNVHISANVTMVGKGTVYIGDGSTIAPGVVIYTSMPNLKTGSTNKYVKGHIPIIGDVKIDKNVFIGANSVIGCGTIIKDNVRIPPLSNIKPFSIIGKNIRKI